MAKARKAKPDKGPDSGTIHESRPAIDPAELKRLQEKSDRTAKEADEAGRTLDRLKRAHAPHEIIGPAIDDYYAKKAAHARGSHSMACAEDHGTDVFTYGGNSGSQLAADTSPSSEWEVPWNPKDPAFMPASRAAMLYTNPQLSLPTLSKHMGKIPVHYMRCPGLGCRVHVGEFHAWVVRNSLCVADEVADQLIDDIESRKEAALDKQKRQHGLGCDD